MKGDRNTWISIKHELDVQYLNWFTVFKTARLICSLQFFVRAQIFVMRYGKTLCARAHVHSLEGTLSTTLSPPTNLCSSAPCFLLWRIYAEKFCLKFWWWWWVFCPKAGSDDFLFLTYPWGIGNDMSRGGLPVPSSADNGSWTACPGPHIRTVTFFALTFTCLSTIGTPGFTSVSWLRD